MGKFALRFICLQAYGNCFAQTDKSNGDRKIILSGSFNPLHDGHLKLLEVATSICGDGYPCFELSAINADKPPLSVLQIKERVMQFKKLPKYYDGSYHRMIETLSGCKRTGCIFIVAGRNVNEYAKCSRGF
ncbi:uncharacterized protein LOC120171262 isoform X1 [Hibiscus syriacus]|uniref:uncharacterized protein LOC120171262 isoform X1 n=1 Tax=Hibiscus syriacus TaxID=106335 RepID=UPI00192510C3|nr:uncharacterized protein LOC120171262 isoform X1 [Hibiscus syriacus]XP_039034925.1 uncharacterized protein LOC120171262 isoform X1 [Hibiscus syriacus]